MIELMSRSTTAMFVYCGVVSLFNYVVLRPSFFNYLVYGSADPIFQDSEKNKNKFFNFFLKKCSFFFFFLQIFICMSQARIKEEDLRLRPA